MSYDLLFFRKKENDLNMTKIFGFFNETMKCEPTSPKRQWIYENKNTGTYFCIDYNNPKNDKTDFNPDFFYTGISFTLNYIRPEFFGLESFRFVENLCKTFDLFIYDSQKNKELLKYTDNFLDEWKSLNKQASISSFKDFNLNYLEVKKSNYSWEYLLNREDFQYELDEDIFVAGIFYIKLPNTNIVHTMSIWGPCIPVILPKTDLVMIKKEMKNQDKITVDLGLAEFDKILNQFNGLIKPYKVKNLDCYILSVEDAVNAEELYSRIDTIQHSAKDIKVLSVDQISNYK